MNANIQYLPPNLAAMGVRRATPPDLITIWNSPYPVLTRYQLLCQDLRIKPYGGGDYKQQGNIPTGRITSGYREIGEAHNSPHMFALALDIAVGDIDKQITWIRTAIGGGYFYRAGLYPQNGFVHLDLCNDLWIKRYNGRRFWVRLNDKYRSFDNMNEAIEFAKQGVEK